MSGYNGRRGPNVSQYVANLNTVVPEDIQATSPDFSMFLDNDLFNDNLDSGSLDFNPSLDVGLSNIEAAPMASQANRTLPATSASDANLNFNIDSSKYLSSFSRSFPHHLHRHCTLPTLSAVVVWPVGDRLPQLRSHSTQHLAPRQTRLANHFTPRICTCTSAATQAATPFRGGPQRSLATTPSPRLNHAILTLLIAHRSRCPPSTLSPARPHYNG